MKRVLWLTFAWLACQSTIAATHAPEDFAYGSEILLEGDGAIWEVVLPPEIYRRVTRADAGDIRVFNADGSAVPHMLRRVQPQTGDAPAPLELSVFPIVSSADDELIGRMMRVVTDETGAVVRAETEAITTGDGERIGAYLVDLSGTTQAPNRLELHWQQLEAQSFTATLRIEASNDLTDWTTLVPEFTIADLRSEMDRLTRRGVELPVADWNYLRITWPPVLRDTELTQVIAQFPTVPTEQPRSWIEIVGVERGDGRSLDFDADARYPIDRGGISFGDDNIIVRGTLSSRPTPESAWQVRHRGIYFSVLSNGEVVKSENFALRYATDRYWQLKLDADQQNFGDHKLVLSLGWTAQILTFVAQGPAPFTLAYGNIQASASPGPVDAVLAAMEGTEQRRASVGRARLSPEIELGGPARLERPPSPFPWKTWLLWAVLITGVALLAWMVVWLLRQLNAATTDER